MRVKFITDVHEEKDNRLQVTLNTSEFRALLRCAVFVFDADPKHAYTKGMVSAVIAAQARHLLGVL